MHNSRNRLALSSVAPGHLGHRLPHSWPPPLDPPNVQRGGFMLRERGEPSFPEDIIIARPALPGARIVALPDEPEPKAPPRKKAAAKPRRKTAKNKAAPKRKAAKPRKAALKKKVPAKKAKAKAAKAVNPAKKQSPAKELRPEAQLPPPPCLPAPLAVLPIELAPAAEPRPARQLSDGLLFAAGMAKVPASASVSVDDRTPILMLPPILPLPRNRSLATADQGLVSRLVRWLGSLLPRKRKRVRIPRSRQRLGARSGI